MVQLAAFFHDVGEIAIPHEIISKEGPLTDEEWNVVRTHTIRGQEVLERAGGVLASVGSIVRASHERWDGLGYPDGLAGEKVPLAARIVTACDAFNAMTTDRPYRPAMTLPESVVELRASAGSQLDPQVVQALLAVVWDPLAPATR